MKRIIAALLCFITLLGAVMLTGCSVAEEKRNTRTVVDMSGKEIDIPTPVNKYCVLYSSSFSICAMLDKDLEYMCMCPSIYTEWPSHICPGINDHVEAVNKKLVTAEQIIEEGTQVVFYGYSTNRETISSLQNAGIACINVGMNTSDDLLKVVDIIADTLGTDYAAKTASSYKEKYLFYQEYVETCVKNIPQQDRLSILVISNLSDITGFGKNKYEAYWSEVVGLDYIPPSNDGADKVNLTMEQVFEMDPDVIVVETLDESIFLYDPSWLSVRAYQEGKLIPAPCALDNWAKPGAESIMVYLWALNAFYPDYAGSLDLITEVRAFYRDFYGYEMSVEYATLVLHGRDIAD